MGPVVDVIIPCFNQAGFLGQAIETALAQDYPQVTVTVVDDGSTDASAVMAARYGDRVRYLRTPNRGLSAARNIGLLAASGEFVLFLDADDYLAPTAVSRHLETIATHPAASVSHSGWQYVDERGESVVEADPYPLEDDPFHLILSGYCPPVNSFVFRREALEAAGPFDEQLSLQEDHDLALRVAAAGHRFVTVPEALATYRRHPASMSATASPSSILDATVAVIRKSQAHHPGCTTCSALVAGSVRDWRMAHLRQMRDELAAADGAAQLGRAVAGVVRRTIGEPSLAVAIAEAGARRVATAARRRAPVNDVVLFVHAMRLARLAQRIRGRSSLPALTTKSASLPALPRLVEADAAYRATVRACIRGARWLGFRDTCLVRSVVLGSLLSDHDRVQLHVGFASPGEGGPLEGHAWVSVDGHVVGGPATATTRDGGITELVIPVSARRRPAQPRGNAA